MWAFILYGVMLLIVGLSLRDFNELKIKKPSFADVAIAIAFLLVMLGAAFTIALIIYSAGFVHDATRVGYLIKEVPLLDLVIVSAIGSVVEEIFFRGYLQQKTNILMASFLFAYFHIIYGSFTEIFVAFFLGMLLGYAFKITKNLSVPIMAHILFNFSMILLAI